MSRGEIEGNQKAVPWCTALALGTIYHSHEWTVRAESSGVTSGSRKHGTEAGVRSQPGKSQNDLDDKEADEAGVVLVSR